VFVPIKDINPTRHRPVMTVALIAINTVVFVYQWTQGVQFDHYVLAYGVTPYEITHNVDLVGLVRGLPFRHEPGPPLIQLTLFTSMFMHGGWLHLLGNMLYLWIFGNNIEDILGPARFLLFYVLCGLGAHAGHILMNPNSLIPTVGASGAIAGVLAAYFLVFPTARVRCLLFLFIFIQYIEVPAAFVILFWFVLQIFGGFSSLSMGPMSGGVAWFAHVGGFLTGLFLIGVMAGRRIRWMRGGRRA
jgi:membrane associated rhomboid family serine protease